ncbi:Crp/Fnr family transcriptional regulator [uncultured Polaribacter sp.]|uniref:Crp/Fnr family transcriptional regulator n=1 Tax=uncultured Polaribacter sp. TaxID=174711 RepID=UPI00261A9BEA|nr:Crp/Fnr family transcriptional regulator [uncultured Polaribacter sp.]
MENLLHYLDAFETISDESKKKLFKLAKPVSFKKGEFLGKLGEKHKFIYILDTGIVRSTFINNKGKEQTRNIFMGNRAVGALDALILDKPAKFSYICSTDCTLFAIHFKKFKKLAKKNNAIGHLYAKILELVFLEVESKVIELSNLNSTERYLKLIKQTPEIENAVKQYHIASFLNITPVQLSRIRRSLIEKSSTLA